VTRVPKRKTAPDLSPDLRDQSDAARPWLGWGYGVGLSGNYNLCRTIPGQVRVLFFLARNARQLPLPEPPVRTFETVKKPLCSNQQKKRTGKTITNTDSRKHAVFAYPFLFRLPVAAEGRFERSDSPIQDYDLQPGRHLSMFLNRFYFSDLAAGHQPRFGEPWAERVSL
jgi:hypothetical protein